MKGKTRFSCTIMRGGTSKGVFLMEKDLPADPDLRERIILAVFGSPDIRQIDGLGGADSLTSKLAIIFIPDALARDSIFEAIDAGIKLVIYLGENMPVHDMMVIKRRLKEKSCRMIGPNTPGIISPDEAKIGFMPILFGTKFALIEGSYRKVREKATVIGSVGYAGWRQVLVKVTDGKRGV